MANKFIDLDALPAIKIEPDFKGWLNDTSLARFIVEIVNQLDASEVESEYNTGGSDAYPPKMMIALFFYSYASGIFSSRKIEQATFELIPVIFIVKGLHPDHTAISTFRKRFSKMLEGLFVQILLIASEMGLLKLGDISLDGTKIKANASKHKALSYEHACKLEDQLKEEVATLMEKSKDPDPSETKDLNIPDEIQRREERLQKISEAKSIIEARRNKRYTKEKQDYEAKMAERAAKEEGLGRKLGGRKPTEPENKPKPSDQVNLTDEESRIMPTSGGGFEQAYNAQAAVDMESMLIIEHHVTQNINDKLELAPAVDKIKTLPAELGSVEKVAADNGYKSKDNILWAVSKGVELYVPSGRQKHNTKLKDMLVNEPVAPEKPTPQESLIYRMATKAGKVFYAKRKSTIEPTFGIIKEVMGFRKFMLRGFEWVAGEWSIVCMAYNLKRLCALNLKIG